MIGTRQLTVRWSAILVIVVALCACAVHRAPRPWARSVPIVFIVISDDDGAREARVDPAELTEWVRFTNSVFDRAGIRFDFDPETGIATHRSTVLNNLVGGGGDAWALAKPLGNDLASEKEGSVVVLLRHGPGEKATGAGFAGPDYAFVVGAGTEDTEHCGRRHDDFLAHEIGHYLGLPHTFAGEPFVDLAAAEARFVASGRAPGVFDGDGLADTPPDPAIRALECQQVESIRLADVDFALPRRNIMSYYEEKDDLSPGQSEIARWVLAQRLASPESMRLPVNAPAPGAIEAEAMQVESIRGAEVSIQPMDAFGVGDWSGGAQLFGRAVGVDGEVTLRFVVKSRIESPVLFATRAPDFVRVELDLDGTVVGSPLDLYAPVVVPTGPVVLEGKSGPFALEPGEHRLTIRVVGRNEASTGWAFGVDAVGQRDAATN